MTAQQVPERVTIGAGGSFTATHICGEDRPHEHCWRVRAWFSVAPRTDVRCYRAALSALLSSWAGKPLPAHLEWNEDIAAAVGTLCNCVGVEVWRDAEDIGARWPQ